MKWDGRLGGHFEENVEVVLRRVAMKNGDRTSFWQEWRAGPPFKLRIIGILRQ